MARRKSLVAVTVVFAALAGCRGSGQVRPAPPVAPAAPARAGSAQAPPNPSPHFVIVFAEADPEVGPAPLSVHFTVFQPPQQDLDEPRYEWDFGDGSPRSNKKSPTHVYERPGRYTAHLKVTDAEGVADDDDVEIQVGEPRAQPDK